MSRTNKFAWGLLCLLIGSEGMMAQTTSEIQGVVMDSQGRAIADAEIIVSGPALIGPVKIMSDAAGSYRAPGLQAGTYDLQVARPGFSAKVYQGLTVTVNRVITFDIALDVGTVQEAVTVRASEPQLDGGVSSSGATI